MDDEKIVEAVWKFVHWLASRSAIPTVPLMDYDELVGELLEEVAKGIKAYPGKPLEELLAILRKMCDNRLYELRHKYLHTHRREAANAFGLEIIDPDQSMGKTTVGKLPDEQVIYTHDLVLSGLRVCETRRRLERGYVRDVFDAIVYGDHNLGEQVSLSGARAAAVFKSGGSVRIKPWHVAEALALPEDVVKEAFKIIKEIYGHVRSEYG